MIAGAKAKCRRKNSSTEKDESTKLTWSIALRRAFGWDVLKCPCGGTRTVVAAVLDETEIVRFLKHLKLHPDPGDIVSITGPPEAMELVEVEYEETWDDFDAPQIHSNVEVDVDDWN